MKRVFLGPKKPVSYKEPTRFIIRNDSFHCMNGLGSYNETTQ